MITLFLAEPSVYFFHILEQSFLSYDALDYFIYIILHNLLSLNVLRRPLSVSSCNASVEL